MELHELGVADPAAGLDGEAEGVAGVLVATRRGPAPDAGVAARGEDHGVGVDHVARAVGQVEAVRAEDGVVAHQESVMYTESRIGTRSSVGASTSVRWISSPV